MFKTFPNIVQEGPKKLHKVTISIQPFQIKLNGFQQNVSRVSENKDEVAVFMQLLNILSRLAQSYCTQKRCF